MINEQKRHILQEAAYIHIDELFLRINVCDETEFYCTDENDGEDYAFTYDELDLYSPDVLLYKLQLIQIPEAI